MNRNPKRRRHGRLSLRPHLLVLTIVLGLSGYIGYYLASWRLSEGTLSPFLITPVFSTLKLFVAVVDATVLKGTTGLEWYYIMIFCAKWLALFQTGHVLFRLMLPYLSRLRIRQQFYHWEHAPHQVMLIGSNDENRLLYQSAEDPKSCFIFCETPAELDRLRAEGYRCMLRAAEEALEDQILRILRRPSSRCVIIINTHDEEKNLSLCRRASDCLADFLRSDRKEHERLAADLKAGDREEHERLAADLKAGDREAAEKLLENERRLTDMLHRLTILVYGDANYETIYQEMEERSLGILRYANVYRRVAEDFVLHHPLTESLCGPKRDWLTKGACVAADVDFNVILVGFGETNRELLLCSVATNQLISFNPGGIPSLKVPTYHIFDHSEKVADKNLNHTLLRYIDSFRGALERGELEGEYFPLPDDPAVLRFQTIDINDFSFYEEIRRICRLNPRSVNRLVIAFGSDLENLDLARKLAAKKREWQQDNLQIFVKVRKSRNAELSDSPDTADCVPFGNEKETVFSLKAVLRDELEEMAFRRNLMYLLESLRKSDNPMIRSDADAEVHATYIWYTMEQNKRLSNRYGILSLRLKLHLMGLDYQPAGGSGNILRDNEAYFALYAEGDRPMLAKAAGAEKKEKDIYAYDTLYPEERYRLGLVRKNLAVQEHYRWNAFMICAGFVPAPISDILAGNIKDYTLRTHGNLTDFEGLFAYRKRLAEEKGISELEADVINWDYQLMDDAWWFLNESGYEIVLREGTTEENLNA